MRVWKLKHKVRVNWSGFTIRRFLRLESAHLSGRLEPPSRPRCSHPILCCSNGPPMGRGNPLQEKSGAFKGKTVTCKLAQISVSHTPYGSQTFHRVAVNRPPHSIEHCKMGGGWQQDWMRWVNDACMGICMRQEDFGVWDEGRRCDRSDQFQVRRFGGGWEKGWGKYVKPSDDEIFRLNTWLNERIFELLKSLRIFGYHEYWTCNPMCQIDVFNNLAIFVPAGQPGKLYAATPIFATSPVLAMSPIHHVMGIAQFFNRRRKAGGDARNIALIE